jgi:tetratricopeptide (TPR) repeat protein
MVHHALQITALSEAYLLAGRLDAAQTSAERALELARARQERGHQAGALRVLGAIAAQRLPARPELAIAYYQQALELANELGMRPLLAHCHLGVGTLYSQIGQRTQARHALSTAVTLFRTMDMTFWAPQAETALARVG